MSYGVTLGLGVTNADAEPFGAGVWHADGVGLAADDALGAGDDPAGDG